MNPILVPILSLFLMSPAPPMPTLKQQLTGTWRLVSYESSDTDGRTWFKRFGDGPKGYIMYDATGHMMVEFEKLPPPPKFSSGDDWTPTADEARAAYLGYVAYFGTYTVDETARAVTHHVEGSLGPSYFGTDQLRPATLEGDRLTLSDGKKFRVVWERVK
ncbi:MAG: lipocalin-like domain-containing protein [Acidobacteriota bacterium]